MFRVLYQGDLFADYFQLALHDEAFPDLPDDYPAETIGRSLMCEPHGVVVHTVRNMTVPVSAEWHLMVEGGFVSPAGCLVLAGLTDDLHTAPRLSVSAGSLGLRASFAGFDTLDDTGLDGDDRYLLQLWPGHEPEGVRVLKSWPTV